MFSLLGGLYTVVFQYIYKLQGFLIFMKKSWWIIGALVVIIILLLIVIISNKYIVVNISPVNQSVNNSVYNESNQCCKCGGGCIKGDCSVLNCSGSGHFVCEMVKGACTKNPYPETANNSNTTCGNGICDVGENQCGYGTSGQTDWCGPVYCPQDCPQKTPNNGTVCTSDSECPEGVTCNVCICGPRVDPKLLIPSPTNPGKCGCKCAGLEP